MECAVLVDLYDATDGDNWFISDGWNVTDPEWDCCSGAYGVQCDSKNGSVQLLQLEQNRLRGDVPPSVGSLVDVTGLCVPPFPRHLPMTRSADSELLTDSAGSFRRTASRPSLRRLVGCRRWCGCGQLDFLGSLCGWRHCPMTFIVDC